MARLRALGGVLRALLGHLRRQPWQAALSLLGVALGVAVVVAIDMAADSARTAHQRAHEASAGQATHRIAGGPLGVSETVYRQLRVDLGVRGAVPVLELRLQLAEPAAGSLRVIGVEPFAQARRLALDALQPGSGDTLVRLLTEPGAALLGAGAAARLQAVPGTELALAGAAAPAHLQVIGVLRPRAPLAAALVDDVALVDIATAQELARRHGWLDAIDLVLDGDDAGAALDRIRAALPPGLLIEPRDAPLRQTAQLTAAFDTNLDMLGVLALLVGLLLVYNTMTFSIVQRREQLGALRALGVTRAELFLAVLGEALLIGVLASALGVWLGQLLAEQLLVLVARTLNDLYFQVEVRELSVQTATLAKAALLGTAGALAAAAVPALEAARTAPVNAMRRSTAEEGAAQRAPWLALAGLALALAGVLLLALPGRALEVAFASLFMVVLGGAACTPWLLHGAVRWLAAPAGRLFGPLAAYAVRGVAASSSRSAVAVAALAVALSATVGVSIMVDSFRSSVDGWLRLTLRADYYVSMPGAGNRSVLPAGLPARLSALPGVADVSLGRGASVRGEHGPLQLLALRLAAASSAGFELLAGSPGSVWQAFDEGAVLVSEPLAWRRGIGVGDRLNVLASDGWQALPVAGIYRDYGSEQGAVLMSLAHYRRLFGDRSIGTAGVFIDAQADREQVAADVRRVLDRYPGLQLTASEDIRALSLAVFDRTFAITRVLRAVTVVVAFVGVLSALMALQLERSRELSLLRATGVTRLQAGLTVLLQTGAMGLTAAILALPTGAAVGVLLVHVVNRRAFGWTMELQLPPALAVQVLVLSLLAALLAGLYPAVRLALRAPAAGLRHE